MVTRLTRLATAVALVVGMIVPVATAAAVDGGGAVDAAQQTPACGRPWNQDEQGAIVDSSKPSGRLVGCISNAAVQYRLQNSTQWQNVPADEHGNVSFDYSTKIAQFRFDAQFVIPKGSITEDNHVFRYHIAGFNGTGTAMSGTLNDDLGTYTIAPDGLVTIVFSEHAISKNAAAPLDNGRLYIEADRSKVTGNNPGQTVLDFGNGHTTTITMYRRSGSTSKQVVGTPTLQPDGTLSTRWQAQYVNTGTIDQPIVRIEDWMAYENVDQPNAGSISLSRGWYTAENINDLYQTLTTTMGHGTLTVYKVTLPNYKGGPAVTWPAGGLATGTYWKWVFQPDSYSIPAGQTLTLQYDSTFANDVLYPASKNISRFVRSNNGGDYFTNNAVAWNPLRPRISLTKTAGGQQTPSAEQCQTMGVTEGHCGLASWSVSVRNAGDGQLPAGWVMQDTGSGVWYTKQLLQDSLRVTVDGKQLTGATQVSSDNGRTWIDLNKAQESQRYTSFRFVADNALAPGKTAAITYQSLFDSSETTVRKNSATAGTGVGGSFVKPVTSSVQVASLVKDGCGEPVDGQGNPKFTSCSANGADYTRTATPDPVSVRQVGWRISAHVTDNWRRAPLVFTETLPEGLSDVKFAFSDYGDRKQWLTVGETRFTNTQGVQYVVTVKQTGDRTYQITIPQQATDLMNEGNVYLYVAARTPDINDGKYWAEGKYDGKRGCVADPTLKNGAGDCLTAKYRNTVSMGSGSIPSVSTSETFVDNFQKTNTGVEDKQNVDGGWSSDGKSFTRTYYVRANRYGLNIDATHAKQDGVPDTDMLPIKDALTVPAIPEGSNPQVTFLGNVTVCLAWIGNGQPCPAGKTYQPSSDAIVYQENDAKLGGVLTVYVPDSTPVTISYQYGFKGSAGFDVANTAQFTNSPWSDAGAFNTNGAAISSSGVIVQTSTMLLHKTDDDASGYRDLAGAKFELLEWDGHDYASSKPTPITAVTDEKGMIVVGKTQGLQCGTAYRIKELQAPLGYEINDEQTDFYLTNCGGGAYFGPTNEDGSPHASVHQWTGGYTVTIRDKKITGSVSWSKVDADHREEYLSGTTWRLERRNDDGTWNKVNDSLYNFADCVGDGNAACAGTGDKDPTVGKLTIDNLDWGTYRLTEITAPGGYRLPDSDRTWAEFTIRQEDPKAKAVLHGRGDWAGVTDNRLTNRPQPVSALPSAGRRAAWVVTIVGMVASGGALAVLAIAAHIRKRSYGNRSV